MNTRQASYFLIIFTLLFLPSACSTPTEIPPTATVTLHPPTATETSTPTPSPVPATPTPTALTCLSEAGQVIQDVLPNTVPPQDFLVYLPPCYEQQKEIRYSVLYLLHGQTYTQDQWVRLGVPTVADNLIHANIAKPFIVIFPDDHYWNAPAGEGFGNRFINNLIPYVDANYRTIADREHRALGGLSRGGGWTVKLGFEHPELFGSLGLHSPAIFKDNAPIVEATIKDIPDELRPNLWFDIGDEDRELGSAYLLEEVLTRNNYIHEFHRFTGDHSEIYWGAHVEDYLLWYTEQWQDQAQEQ